MKKHKPVIEFVGYKIDNIHYSRGDENLPEITEDMTLDNQGNMMQLKLMTGLTKDKENGLVNIKLKLINQEMELAFDLEMSGEYKIIDTDLSVDQIEEYLSMNGTAILFPYVRSVASIVTSLDSSEAIILPTINTKIFG